MAYTTDFPGFSGAPISKYSQIDPSTETYTSMLYVPDHSYENTRVVLEGVVDLAIVGRSLRVTKSIQPVCL
jgi:hypothetical protein